MPKSIIRSTISRSFLRPSNPRATQTLNIGCPRFIRRATATMTTIASVSAQATPSEIALSSTDTRGIYHSPYTALTDEQTKLTSRLLNQNHTDHHIYFNTSGFHNHIVHHLLSLYALNATSSELQLGYDQDASYQRTLNKPDQNSVADMLADRRNIVKYLNGDEKRGGSSKAESDGTLYADFLEYWTKQIETLGAKGVLDEFIFKRDEIADKLFGRLFAGFLHPLIHLGFALEFHQPALVTEALAQTAIHDNWVSPLIQACEASSTSLKSQNIASKPLTDLLAESFDNQKLRDAPLFSDGNKLRDGVLARAKDELVGIASQWFIPQDASWDTIEEKVAEHIHATFIFAAAAALHTSVSNSNSNSNQNKEIKHQPRFDFFYIHDTNASIFYSAFAKDPKIRDILGKDNIIRLLETKAWMDIGMYVSRGSPAITTQKFETIRNYETRVVADRGKGWAKIFERTCALKQDDGHAVKFIRALANAERECKKYEHKEWCVIKGDMWERIGWMAIDSFEPKPLYVRSAGWDEAWKDVPEWKDASFSGRL